MAQCPKLLDCVTGTTYLSIYVTLNLHTWSSIEWWKCTAHVLARTRQPSECCS